MKLGDWLIGKGRITREQLDKALHHQDFFGERLGHSLIKLGFIDEDVLGEYLADIAGAHYLPATRLERIGPDVIHTVPARLAAKYCIVPVAIEARKLHLAMREPRDLLAIDEIAFLTGMPIEPYVASEFRLIQAIEKYYGIHVGPQTIPVAGATPSFGRPPAAARKTVTPASPAKPAASELGLDGLPIDANPDDLDQPFVTTPAGPPPEHAEMDQEVPVSMEEWRAAQEATPVADPPTVGAKTGPYAAPLLPAQTVVSGPGTPPPRPAGPAATVPPAPASRVSGAVPAVTPSPASARPVAVPAPGSMEAVSLRLRDAETRDEVFSAILDFASVHFRRAALFVVQQDRVLGWSGRGEGLFPSRIRNVIVPLDRPSLFVFFRSGADYYYGPVPDLPANAKFYLDLGCPPPARVLLVPLSIMDRPAVILYGDNGPEKGRGPDIQVFRRLLAKGALALEVLILRNKITMI